jgi:hypothetical protein
MVWMQNQRSANVEAVPPQQSCQYHLPVPQTVTWTAGAGVLGAATTMKRLWVNEGFWFGHPLPSIFTKFPQIEIRFENIYKNIILNIYSNFFKFQNKYKNIYDL